MPDYVDRYLQETGQVLESLDRAVRREMLARLGDLRERKGRLFVLGVGGSASNASHAVNDFRKIAGIESYAPTDNVAELTAWINDEGWDRSIERWPQGSRLGSDDAIMVLSVGGGSDTTSVNLVWAMDYAKSVGDRGMAIVSRDGGHAARIGDAVLLIPPPPLDTITPLAESFQAIARHLLVTGLARGVQT